MKKWKAWATYWPFKEPCLLDLHYSLNDARRSVRKYQGQPDRIMLPLIIRVEVRELPKRKGK